MSGGGELVPLAPPVLRRADAFGPPPVLQGHATPEVQSRVAGVYRAMEQILESWVSRSESIHTRRAYRDDVMSFVRFLGVAWPEAAPALLQVSKPATLPLFFPSATASHPGWRVSRRTGCPTLRGISNTLWLSD